MEIYLIRHTTPNIAKGICYGQTDLDITDTFEQEVVRIKPHLPKNIQTVFSSPRNDAGNWLKCFFRNMPFNYMMT